MNLRELALGARSRSCGASGGGDASVGNEAGFLAVTRCDYPTQLETQRQQHTARLQGGSHSQRRLQYARWGVLRVSDLGSDARIVARRHANLKGPSPLLLFHVPGQWDIWEAVFSPVCADGHPCRLYDKRTGALNASVAAYVLPHDSLKCAATTTDHCQNAPLRPPRRVRASAAPLSPRLSNAPPRPLTTVKNTPPRPPRRARASAASLTP